MKTLLAFMVMLLITLTFSETAFGGSDPKNSSQKIPKITIESLIIGLNSDNTGVIIGCAKLAGEIQIIETVEHLTRILNSDLTFDVKIAAVYALYQIQNKEALIALKKASIRNNNPFLRQTAEVFLNYYLINNPDKDVRIEENYLANDW